MDEKLLRDKMEDIFEKESALREAQWKLEKAKLILVQMLVDIKKVELLLPNMSRCRRFRTR